MRNNISMSRTMAQLVLEQTKKRIAHIEQANDPSDFRIGSPLWVERWDLQRIKSHIERQLSRDQARPTAAANQ